MQTNKTITLLRGAALTGLCGLLLVLQTGCALVNRPTPIIEENTQSYQPGKFVWHDLLTSDVATTKAFYGQLFNWTFETHGKYTIVKLDGKRIGGILDVQPATSEPHVARWISSLSVDSVDQAVVVVLANGGKVHMQPEDILDRGRAALVSDPQGAQLSLIHTVNGDPLDAPVPEHSWLWHELWTNHSVEAANFYTALAGYSAVEELDSYAILKTGDKWRAGIRPLFNQALEQRWVPVVKVGSVKLTSNSAKQLGGKVIIASEHPDYADQVALLADPSGALFMIQEWPGDNDSKGESIQ